MESYGPEVPFVDNGSAPEFFANGLHDVDVMGSVCRFVLYKIKRAADGTFVREAELTVIMPCEAVGPGIMLTLQRLGAGITQSLGSAAKRLVTELLH